MATLTFALERSGFASPVLVSRIVPFCGSIAGMTDEQIALIMTTVKLIQGVTPSPDLVAKTYASCLVEAQKKRRDELG